VVIYIYIYISHSYPMARSVRVQAMAAVAAADGKLSRVQERRWFNPDIVDAAPTTPASKANITKNPVAAFPIGKYMGEKCAGRSNPGPAMLKPD
jgi:hypothetical protein